MLSRCILNGRINSWIKTIRCFLLFYIIFDRFGSFQILCTIKLHDHRIEPGTALQCKIKDSSCHRQRAPEFPLCFMCNNISQREDNCVCTSVHFNSEHVLKGKIVHKMVDIFSQTIYPNRFRMLRYITSFRYVFYLKNTY